jgi:transposase
MKAFSTDLREKIALAYEDNDYTLDEVADLFDVGRRTVARFVQMQRSGLSLSPRPHAGGFPPALTLGALALLRDKVVQSPDAMLSELASYLKTEAQVRVHASTICRGLQKLGLPRKKRAWLLRRGMSNSAKIFASAWRKLIAASSSLPMKQAFILRLREPSAAPRVASAWSGMRLSTAGRITA